MTPSCINLLARFGAVYRIAFDPAYDRRNIPRRCLDPWAMVMPCHYGTIYPHGGDVLAIELDVHPVIARRLAALPGVTLYQDGHDEKTFHFPIDLFEQVAEIVRPKRRRTLTAEQKAKLAAANQATRFRGAGARKTAPGTLATPLADPRAA
jgi:hypothetical protein